MGANETTKPRRRLAKSIQRVLVRFGGRVQLNESHRVHVDFDGREGGKEAEVREEVPEVGGSVVTVLGAGVEVEDGVKSSARLASTRCVAGCAALVARISCKATQLHQLQTLLLPPAENSQ